jgi:ABC-type branched-subunit amino acid transport system ATPase component
VAELFDWPTASARRQLPQGDKKLLTWPPPSPSAGIILLDEPTSGVSPREVGHHGDPGPRPAHGVKAIIQVEHDMDIVFGYRIASSRPPGKGPGRRDARRDPRRRAGGGMVIGRATTSRAELEGRVFIQSSHILRQVSLEVRDREVVCLVGRNGAGKTTTLRAIMGYLRPRSGRIVFQGEAIHRRRTHEIAQRGLGFAPEDGGIFADLTVAENIEIATWTRPGGRPATERVERAYEVFPALRYRTARAPR